MKTWAIILSAALLYCVGFGATWQALATWYPDEDCAVASGAMTVEQFEAASDAHRACEQDNSDMVVGRLFGSFFWPVVLPVQLGMRTDLAGSVGVK